ncbi:F-box protein At2g26160-like [Chenopodium quinoa]|uniref:DUF295 domain-containing protein n=1 Tax=Chenopodium quinoa TaxID=63459 RepID=A0A803LIQ3_CHEQI|nr:F-box protein At2g26160-like [Chenopodium quinoa]
MAKAEIQVDWSEIPDDILLKIAQTLTIYSDYIRLRAVCSKWRISLPIAPPHTLPCQLPWLLLPPPTTSITPYTNFTVTDTDPRRTFYNFLTNKLHTLSLPESSYPRRILGSCHGNLILTTGTPEVFCLNPLSKSKVFLPPLSALPGVVSFRFSNVGREYLIQDQLTGQIYPLELKQMRDDFIRKLVLSCPPSNGLPSFAFGITTSFLCKTTELVFCNISEDHWVWVPVSNFTAEDVIYSESQGLFYAVNHVGDVGSFRVGVEGVCDITIWQSVSLIPCDLRYLVLFNGELMMLTRCLETEVDIRTYCELYRTAGFEVYRFSEYEPGRVCWEPVKSLGDGMVFVGESASLALSASDFPGCKANCVYFTDDHCNSNDVGVFDLEEKCICSLPCFPDNASLPLYWGSPIWITPNPH